MNARKLTKKRLLAFACLTNDDCKRLLKTIPSELTYKILGKFLSDYMKHSQTEINNMIGSFILVDGAVYNSTTHQTSLCMALLTPATCLQITDLVGEAFADFSQLGQLLEDYFKKEPLNEVELGHYNAFAKSVMTTIQSNGSRNKADSRAWCDSLIASVVMKLHRA